MWTKKGFTLIELLVVVLIIGILAGVALPQYQRAVLKAKYSKILPALKAIAAAQEAFYLANGRYADSFDDLDISIVASSLPAGQRCSGWTATQEIYSEGGCFTMIKNMNAVRGTLPFVYDEPISILRAGQNGYYYLFSPTGFAPKKGLYCWQSADAKNGHCTGLSKTFENAWGRGFFMGSN